MRVTSLTRSLPLRVIADPPSFTAPRAVAADRPVPPPPRARQLPRHAAPAAAQARATSGAGGAGRGMRGWWLGEAEGLKAEVLVAVRL